MGNLLTFGTVALVTLFVPAAGRSPRSWAYGQPGAI